MNFKITPENTGFFLCPKISRQDAILTSAEIRYGGFCKMTAQNARKTDFVLKNRLETA